MIKDIHKAIKIAIYLLVNKRIFFYLFLFPLVISLILLAGQLFFTILLYYSIDKQFLIKGDASKLVEQDKENKQISFLRYVLTGSKEPLSDIRLCPWVVKDGLESPVNKECSPNILDVALIGFKDLKDIEQYKEFFKGSVSNIHLCKSCSPAITIKKMDNGEIKTDVYSIYGLGILYLSFYNDKFYQAYNLIQSFKRNSALLLGVVQLRSPVLYSAIKLNSLPLNFSIAISVSTFLIILSWLILRSYKNVIDYFAKSGVLLPLLVSMGKVPVYLSLWIITFLRAFSFMFFSILIFFVVFYWNINNGGVLPLKDIGLKSIFIWGCSLFSSLLLSALIGIIAELKARFAPVGGLLKLFPFLLAIFGGILWSATFLVEVSEVIILRDIISFVPILGIVPIILYPVVKCSFAVLFIHFSLSLIILAILVRSNIEWFVRHLERL